MSEEAEVGTGNTVLEDIREDEQERKKWSTPAWCEPRTVPPADSQSALH